MQNPRCSPAAGIFCLRTETFKNRNPAFFYSNVVFLLGSKGPADTLGLPDIPADPGAEVSAVGKFIGSKIGKGQKVFQILGENRTEDIGKL